MGKCKKMRCIEIPRGNGKRYEESFRKETVKYILENNKSVTQVAQEIGVKQNT